MVFWDRALGEIIRFRWGDKVGDSQLDQWKRRHSCATWDHSQKAAMCEPGREPSSAADHAGSLDLVLPASKTVINFCLSHLSLWCFLMSGGADNDMGDWCINFRKQHFITQILTKFPFKNNQDILTFLRATGANQPSQNINFLKLTFRWTTHSWS